MSTPSPGVASPTPIPDSPEKVLTQRLTSLFAASILSDPDFPSASLLPRVARLPYNNLGHQLLLDYRLLASTLWGCVLELTQERGKLGRRKAMAWLGGIVLGAILAVILSPVGLVIMGPIVGILTVAIAWPRGFVEKAASIKADHVRHLVDGRTPPSAAAFGATVSERHWAQAGTGVLDPDRPLVFFANGDSDPFPGLGWIQARELFICPSADVSKTKRLDVDSLFGATHGEVVAALRDAALPGATYGCAVVVDPHTVKPDSAWLGPGRRPRLHLDGQRAPSASELAHLDGQASARAYSGAQVTLPEHLTCVTVFVRPFPAGTSAALEVLVLTLGPPDESFDDVRLKLHLHERSSQPRPSGSQTHRSELSSRLELLRLLHSSRSDPFRARTAYDDLPALKAHDEDAVLEETRQADELAEEAPRWTGLYTRPSNWRELHSLTVTRDFFGTSECKACARALYDHITRRALAGLEELGFDISQYHDASGRWTIQADKIEQMVVGERITLQDGRKQAQAAADGEAS